MPTILKWLRSGLVKLISANCLTARVSPRKSVRACLGANLNKLILFLLALLLCFCSAATEDHGSADVWYQPKYVIGTTGLDNNQKAVALMAATAWNQVTSDGIKIGITDKPIPEQIEIQQCPPDDQWDGGFVHDQIGNHIYACDHGSDYGRLLQILTHEMGHMLGLDHICQGCGIMSPNADSPGAVISQADLTECRRVKACATQ